ncbi:MAG: hypothetical protein CMH83_18915 [Nocardioides sp.]|nr:hypothetical protein [Nocardioides sp.]
MLLVGALALVVVVAATAVALLLRGDGRTRLQEAMALTPADAARLSWTDWAGVRAELGLDLGDDPRTADVRRLLDRGFDADLTSTSALVSSAAEMQKGFDFSPATLEWELFRQGDTGASILMRLADTTDVEDVASALRALGYAEPDDADGTWSSDSESLPISARVTPELAFIALDRERGVVVAADSSAGVDQAREALDEDVAGPDVPDDVVAALGSPLSAALYTGSQVCRQLAMGNADADAQAEADSLLARAGDVNPLTGFGIAAQPDGSVVVAMGLETEEQARANADTRAALATGSAPGQGGSFPERFTLAETTADGTVVRMVLDPVPGSYVLSDLSTGPVLFATC